MLPNVFVYLLNTLIIQLSIIAFCLPFFVIYMRSSKHATGHSISWHIQNFFSSKQANALIFCWALAEAFIWFVIPEFLLLLMVFMRVRRKRQLLTYDILGTVAGTILALNLNLSDSAIESLPYVQQNMITQAHVWFTNLDVWALLHQPFSGVPFKVFNHVALDHDVNIFLYILLAVVVRVSRYALFYFLLKGIYRHIHKFVYKNYTALFIIATAIFAVLLYDVYQSFGPDYVIRTGL